VKLWGHFFRYPADILFLPIYVLFGYFHGAIKAYGLFTLSETTWGSRDGADTDDRVRMIRLPRYGSSDPDGRKSETFEFSNDLIREDYLPAYEPRRKHSNAPVTNHYHD